MGDLIYRECLEEKLKDLYGYLMTGRDSFSWDSKLYKNLAKEIDNVLRFLDAHSGEEWLEDEDKKKLEEKIHSMKEAAKPYMEDKHLKGGWAPEAPDSLRKRYKAAYEILLIDSKIPDNPGAELGIIPPNRYEPGDKPETEWRLKWKQNVRYLAKKQIATYVKKYNTLGESEELQQDEFNALMDFLETDKLLVYKDDAELCQRYPKMRIMLEKAIRATEKLSNMEEKDLTSYMYLWEKTAREKSLVAVQKSIERSGREFTEADRIREEEKLKVLIKNKASQYRSIEMLTKKGDELEQVARFVDLKMKVISNKNYVKPLKKMGATETVQDCEKNCALADNENDKQYYQNLRDIRELEEVGIQHKRKIPGIDKAFYRSVEESANKTIKKEFLGFRIGKPGYKGVGASNDSYGATEDSTSHSTSYGGGMKLRLGKIGLKLHNDKKTVQLSGGIAFGQVKTSASVGTSYLSPNQDAILAGESSGIRGRIKLKIGDDDLNASVGANASVGYVCGSLKAGLGNITIKDKNGNEKQAYGLSANAGAIATGFKGGGSASFSILGVSVGVSFTGYAAGVGGQAGIELAMGSAKLSLAGVLGLGAGLAVSINWVDAIERAKKSWCAQKLQKLINTFKEKKKEMKASGKLDARYRVNLEKEPVVRAKLKKKPQKDNFLEQMDKIDQGPLINSLAEKKPEKVSSVKIDKQMDKQSEFQIQKNTKN